ncbi:MAG: methyl-accepting chemotaxis protein [Iodobacter sp.]
MSISQRLIVLIFAAVFSLCLVAGVAAKKLHDQQSSLTDLADNSMASTLVVNRIATLVNRNRIVMFVHMLSPNDQQKATNLEEINKNKQLLAESMAAYRKLIQSPAEQELFDRLNKTLEEYGSVFDGVIKISTARDLNSAYALADGRGFTSYRNLTAAVDKLIKFNEESARQTVADSGVSYRNTLIVFAITIGISLCLIIVFGIWIFRAIRNPLIETLATVLHIESQLDFTRRFNVKNGDEIGRLVQAFNHLLDSVQKSFSSIGQDIQYMASSAGEVSASAKSLSDTAGLSSEAASHMAASVEQVTVSINHVAGRAQDAHLRSEESGNLAVNGERVISATITEIEKIAGIVHDSSAEMSDLQLKSNEIRSVVGVIKDIADQTNLLALNAAIEAARAGEQGRSFAVVADEVRKLAERTSLSAQEITGTIGSIQSGADRAVSRMHEVVAYVEGGVVQARQAGAAIAEIRSSSALVAGFAAEISQSLAEQGSASLLMAQQVEQIAHMAEETSGEAKSAADSAENLRVTAESVRQTIAQYRL